MSDMQSSGNRRASRRRPPKSSSKIYCYRGPMGLGANLAVSVLDVSETGANLVVKAPFRRGEEMELNLEGIVHRRPIRKTATVVWCVATDKDRWVVGIKFQGVVRYADLTDLTRS
jgi:PilZ domain